MKKENTALSILKLGVILLIITSVVGTIVSLVFKTTEEQIALNNKVSTEDLLVVMPENESIKEVTEENDLPEEITEMYVAYKGNDEIGYVYKTEVMGYKDIINILVGIDKENTLVGTKIMKQAETPGLGDLIGKEKFIGQFFDKSIDEDLIVVKGDASSESEISAVTGATVSSSTVVFAVNKVIEFHKTEILGEEALAPEEPNIENMNLIGSEMIEIEGENKAFEIKDGDKVTGYIVYGKGLGYYDTDIIVAVGFDLDTKIITNIMVTEEEETEGLGTVIKDDGFKDLFKGNDAVEQEVQVYSGATLSSKGAIDGINDAVDYFNNVLQGGN